MQDYNHEQDCLARKLRETIAEFDTSEISREEVAEVLEREAIHMTQGSKENMNWLPEKKEERPDN